MTTIAYRTCPLCEATCGLELHLDGRRDHARPRRPRRRVQPRLPLPEGHRAQAARGRPRPAAHAADPARRRRGTRSTWDEAFAEIDDAARRDHRRARPRRGRACTSATRTRTTSAPCSYNRVLLQALGTTQRLLGEHRRPDAEAGVGRPDVRHRAVDPGARPRPHRLPADARREPVRVERQPVTAPDFPGRLARAAGARRQARRRRPAPHEDRRGGRRAPRRSGPAPTRCSCSRSCTCCSPRASSTSATVAPHVDGVDDGRARSRRDVRTRARRRRAAGIDADDDPPHRARARGGAERAAVYGRIGTCTQEFGTLASWLVDVLTCSPATSTGRAARCSPSPRPASANTGGTAGKGRGVRFGRRAQPGARPARVSTASCRSRASPRRSRRRATARSARWSPSPATRCSSTPDAGRLDRALASLDFMVSVDIYLNETTRHADVILPRRAGARARPLRPRALPARDPQRRELLAAARRARAGRDAGVGDPAAPRRRSSRARAPTPTSTRSTTSSSAGSCRRPVTRDGLERRGPRRRRAADALASRRGPERVLDLMLRTGPYGDGFGADPDGLSLAVLEANPHGIDLGPLQPRIPEVLRTPSGKIELAPEPIVADVARLRAVARPRRRTAGSCSSAGATCARTTRGCTTSTCS